MRPSPRSLNGSKDVVKVIVKAKVNNLIHWFAVLGVKYGVKPHFGGKFSRLFLGVFPLKPPNIKPLLLFIMLTFIYINYIS